MLAAVQFAVVCRMFRRREHLSEEDLRKNKAMLEGLTKGQLLDNPEVMNCTGTSSLLFVSGFAAGNI